MEMNENLYSFLLRAPKKSTPNDYFNLSQKFLDKCEQAYKGAHDEKIEDSEIFRPRTNEIF